MWIPTSFWLLLWPVTGQCVCFTPGLQLLSFFWFSCIFLGVVPPLFVLWFKGHFHLYVTTLWKWCFALGLEVAAGLSAYCTASQLYFVWCCAINLSFSYLWLFVFLFGFWCWLSSLFFVHTLGYVWIRVRDYKEFSLWSKTSLWQHCNGILPFVFIWSSASNSVVLAECCAISGYLYPLFMSAYVAISSL